MCHEKPAHKIRIKKPAPGAVSHWETISTHDVENIIHLIDQTSRNRMTDSNHKWYQRADFYMAPVIIIAGGNMTKGVDDNYWSQRLVQSYPTNNTSDHNIGELSIWKWHGKSKGDRNKKQNKTEGNHHGYRMGVLVLPSVDYEHHGLTQIWILAMMTNGGRTCSTGKQSHRFVDTFFAFWYRC